MAEFQWHKMADEAPRRGVRDFVVIDRWGGTAIAHAYVETDYPYFRLSKSGNMLIERDFVYAWAEIPPLEVEDDIR